MAIFINNVWWLERDIVMQCEGIRRAEVFNRMAAWDPSGGPARSSPFYVWRDVDDLRRQAEELKLDTSALPRRGRMIDYRYLSTEGQIRWGRLAQASQPAAQAAGPANAGAVPTEADQDKTNGYDHPTPTVPSGQLSLGLPETPQEKVLAAVLTELLERDPANVPFIRERFYALQDRMNHDYRTLGFATAEEHLQAKAACLGISAKRFWALQAQYKKTEAEAGTRAAILSLGKRTPGPAAGTGSMLAPDDKTFITRCWTFERMSRKRTYESWVAYKIKKAKTLGGEFEYSLAPNPEDPDRKPGWWAVMRFIHEDLGGNDSPERNGPTAIKDAAGYIDREYDEAAGDAWCTDEWEMDVYAADREFPRRVYNWGGKNPVLHLICYLDERTTCILDWMLTTEIDKDTPTLAERMVRRYWLPKRLVADRAGRFRRLVDKYKFTSSTGELVEKISGPLGMLGVYPRGSSEKNPRANRIERMHLEFSRRAQDDFGRSWRPTKASGLREASGIDARVAEHLRRRHASDPSELIYLDQIQAIAAKWVEEINNAPTEAKGCNGMTRLEAFQYYQPTPAEIAARRPTSAEIDLAFAERDELMIRKGGIIVWSDGLRYSTSDLVDNTGELVPVLRYRRDPSKIFVEVDGSTVTAKRRVVVGTNGQDLLADEMEKQNRLRKQLARSGGEAPTLENAPALEATPEAETRTPDPDHDVIGSPEWMARRPAPKQPAVRVEQGVGFADLE
jgi:hypothetical protein